LTTDLESTVATLKAVHGTDPHFMFNYDPLTLVGIGDVLVIGGTDGALEPIHGSFGPWIVEDIDDAKGKLLANGASVVQDIKDISNGRMMYMKHADGTVVGTSNGRPS
jgi:predicted enzyme related to lactoylglutathione lyase